MRFTALDFETANSFIGSICAVGLAVVEDGAVIDKKYWLIKPHKDHRYFDPFNVYIHGITKDMVADASEFDTVYTNEIASAIQGTVLAAHNAAFDMSALRHVLDLYHIEYPSIQYVCTFKAAQRAWAELENHKLDTVSRYLNFQFTHHNALEDALACANILLEVFKEKQLGDFNALTQALGMRIGQLYAGGYEPCSTSKACRGKKISAQTDQFDPTHALYGMKVVFTGTLLSMPREEAMQRVADAGGFVADTLTADTNFLVAGVQDASRLSGSKVSVKTKKALDLICKGNSIRIIDEKEFIRMIG